MWTVTATPTQMMRAWWPTTSARDARDVGAGALGRKLDLRFHSAPRAGAWGSGSLPLEGPSGYALRQVSIRWDNHRAGVLMFGLRSILTFIFGALSLFAVEFVAVQPTIAEAAAGVAD